VDTGKKIFAQAMDEEMDLGGELGYLELEAPSVEDEEVETEEKYFSKGKKEEKLPDDYWQNFDKMIPKHSQKKNFSMVAVRVGDKIKHKKWGLGVVENVEDSTNDKVLFIQFQNFGTKKVLQSVAPIEVLNK